LNPTSPKSTTGAQESGHHSPGETTWRISLFSDARDASEFAEHVLALAMPVSCVILFLPRVTMLSLAESMGESSASATVRIDDDVAANDQKIDYVMHNFLLYEELTKYPIVRHL
jgi:hypothetical protein